MKRFYGVGNPTKKQDLIKAFGNYFEDLQEEFGDIAIYLYKSKKGYDKELVIYPKGSKSQIARIELCYTWRNKGRTVYQKIHRKKVISEIEVPMFRD